MSKYELKYKTFNQLLDEVSVDFSTYSLEGMISPEQLIKVATRVNYDLGLRINKTKETILDIDGGKARLPFDFYILNYALLCHKYRITQPAMGGTYREDVLIPDNPCCPVCEEPEPSCYCPNVCVTTCSDKYMVVEKTTCETRIYEEYENIRLKASSTISKDCFNLTVKCGRNGEIKNGFIYTDVQYGKLYLSYEGALEDDEGNLLVLDHPMINEFYETAMKHRILENLYMNGEPVEQKLGYMRDVLRVARTNALSIVNMPDFDELKQVFDMNRKAQYHKYYYMFAS